MVFTPFTSQEHAAEVRSSCRISDIGRFDNWDKRECAVDADNVAWWRAEVDRFLASGPPSVPKHIHQIWIGNREPPCVWLDTWRVNFMSRESSEWSYSLWDNERADAFHDMINRDLFDKESMWQCKADIMRLEILYKYGGVYIDADMVSLGKPLDQVLDTCNDTGFLIGFEPDTKDKPYSVLGNSIIMASKGHPLLRLLISYIYQIYDHKRPHHTVEWVTGPLACTKALVHTGMKFTTPPSVLFYPMFHYVPNPSAIDFSAFPDSICFQFGYSCSSLSRWVEQNQKCRRALECPYHSKKSDYPLGKINPFPKYGVDAAAQSTHSAPKIIHQFQLSGCALPTRWCDSWSKGFCAHNPEWDYKLWTHESLAELDGFFCANLYPSSDRSMDQETITLLALELLYKLGGYYVPLSCLYHTTDAISDEVPLLETRDLMRWNSIIASPAESPSTLGAIQKYYESGVLELPLSISVGSSNVVTQGFDDSIVAYTDFPKGSRFLGASELFFSTTRMSTRKMGNPAHVALRLAYDFQVPIIPVADGNLSAVHSSPKHLRKILVIDPDLALLPNLFDAIPGFIHRACERDSSWDLVLVGVEWSSGVNEEIVYDASGPFRDERMTYFAVILNANSTALLPQTFVKSNDIAEAVLGHFNQKNVMIGAVRFAENEQVTSVFQAKSVVTSVFQRICNHAIPPWDCDSTEFQGNLLKGLRSGQLAYEISVDEEKRVMYRAFNDNGGLNCEIKFSQGSGGRHLVDYARVFYDHAVVFEGQQIAL